MRTKEQILFPMWCYEHDAPTPGSLHKKTYPVEQVHAAMDIYAKEMAVGFKKFTDKEGWIPRTNEKVQWGYQRQENQMIWSKWVTGEQLFELYLKSKKSNGKRFYF